MELDEKYVLPLTIEEDPSYVQNKYKGRYKALLGVNLFNDYSGTYNTTLMNIYIEGTTTDPAKVDTRLARVVDENTIFFYAGSTWVELGKPLSGHRHIRKRSSFPSRKPLQALFLF